MKTNEMSCNELARQLHDTVAALKSMGRTDLIVEAIGRGMLDELRETEAGGRLSRLRVTSDYRLILVDMDNREVELQPVHKAVYLLFLNHPEGIEFKHLVDYRDELCQWYRKTSRIFDTDKIDDTVSHLINPLDNAINEKCSRIKRAFLDIMDEYSADYYIISGHAKVERPGSSKVWYRRLKVITLPRHLVIYE